MVTKTETLPHAGGFIASEAPGTRSRSAVTILSGENRQAGSVMGKAAGVVTSVADAGNTGDGTMAALPTTLADVQFGAYELIVIAAALDAGTFLLKRPDGSIVDVGTVGVAFAKELSFTLQDGATDFAVGDRFTITVPDSGKWKLHDAANTDGSDTARGILFDDVDASAADERGVVVDRDAEVQNGDLVFFAGATQQQKDAALADLAKVGIKAI